MYARSVGKKIVFIKTTFERRPTFSDLSESLLISQPFTEPPLSRPRTRYYRIRYRNLLLCTAQKTRIVNCVMTRVLCCVTVRVRNVENFGRTLYEFEVRSKNRFDNNGGFRGNTTL